MSDATCGICGGTKAEHFGEGGKAITQHVFSEEGRLISHAEADRMNRPPQTPFIVPQRINGTDASAIQRLLGLMLERGTLSSEEVLYVVGVGPKPEPERSGYMDPGLLVGGSGS